MPQTPFKKLFEKLWEEPDKWVEHLKPYKAVLTPDFSMYLEMPDSVKLFNTFRNRWCGAYMAEKELRVIPTVNWGGPSSFDYGNHADQKDFFMAGYNEMLRLVVYWYTRQGMCQAFGKKRDQAVPMEDSGFLKKKQMSVFFANQAS